MGRSLSFFMPASFLPLSSIGLAAEGRGGAKSLPHMSLPFNIHNSVPYTILYPKPQHCVVMPFPITNFTMSPLILWWMGKSIVTAIYDSTRIHSIVPCTTLYP